MSTCRPSVDYLRTRWTVQSRVVRPALSPVCRCPPARMSRVLPPPGSIVTANLLGGGMWGALFLFRSAYRTHGGDSNQNDCWECWWSPHPPQPSPAAPSSPPQILLPPFPIVRRTTYRLINVVGRGQVKKVKIIMIITIVTIFFF